MLISALRVLIFLEELVSTGYQSVDVNSKDKWRKWRHPQYVRDKYSLLLRSNHLSNLLKETLGERVKFVLIYF